MNRKLALIFSLFVFILILPSVYADFDQAYVRLDSLKTSSALSGTVCAKPSSISIGTENKVIVEFPSDFSISTTTSNWTTSTTNLPNGATAWPSIGGSASSISSNSVTFSSGDLSQDILYCFNFSGSSSTTSSSTGNDKTGTITTKNSSNTTIDSITYAVSIVTSNTINVTASVNPKVSDLQIDVASQDSGTQFPQNTTLTYTVTYGSYLTNTFPITIEAEWSQGTISGNSTPSVDILDYVTASATNGINSTSPVIDLVNRKITWEFSSFPASSTGNTVTFKLKTNSSYTGSSSVAFNVMARAIANTTTTPDDTVSQSYLYTPAPTPTPTATSTPTPTTAASSTTSTTSTPTPSPTPISTLVINPAFEAIELRTILESSSTIFVSASQETKMRLSFGKSLRNLDKTISFSDFVTGNIFELKDLESNTDYYFKIFATNSSGKIISSDIYTFKTAKGKPAKIEENSIVVTSKNNIIYNTVITDTIEDQALAKKEQFIVIPLNTNYQLTFSFKGRKSVKRAKIILKKLVSSSKRVLGFNTFTNEVEAATDNVTLLEIKPGVYTATVRSHIEPGVYELIVDFIDENGNLSQENLGLLKITNPFTVSKKDNKEPVEGARIFLYIYNLSSKVYIPLSSSDLNIKNPSFTNNQGVADFVLPKGKYKAQITDIGYKEKTVSFAIEDSDTTDYPIVYLQRQNPNLLRIIAYYLRGFNEVFLVNTAVYADSLRFSIRFFDLVSAVILSSLVILTLFAFSHRHSIDLKSFVSYFFYLLTHKQRNKKYINGVVFDQHKNPVTLANVYLTDIENEQIVQNTKTNGKGEFFFKKGEGKYQLMVMKKGYQPTPQLPYQEKEDVSFKITMEKRDIKSTLSEAFFGIFSSLFGMSFETLGLLSLAFEILFIPSFGLAKTLPFLSISIFNIFLWTLHLRHHHR